MSFKSTLKRTNAYQYYNCAKQYQKNSENAGIVSALIKSKPILYRGNEKKTKQIADALRKVMISNCGKGGFFYSIDERVIIYNKHKIIENMPIDYQLIVDNSLEDLEIKLCNNSTLGIQNKEMLSIFRDYILRANRSDESSVVLRNIITKRAETLKEALQRILFINQFLWQTGHKLVGLGRLDKILDRFLESKDEEQIIKDFLLTLHEHYHFKSSEMPGDTGQIIILGGKNSDGSYFSNRFTYKFIDCLRDLNIPDPKILVRVSSSMPDSLLETSVNSIATGIGSPLLANDDIVIDKLLEFGYKKEDAYGYGVSACWEPLSIGKSLEQNNIGSIEFGRAFRNTIEDDKFLGCRSFEELLKLYFAHLAVCVEKTICKIDSIVWEKDPLVSLFTHGCQESNKDISEGGALYNDYGLLSEGMSSAVNSLLNIKSLCYLSNQSSLTEIRNAVLSNYEGNEHLRVVLKNCENGFGTDSQEAECVTNSILEFTNGLLCHYRNKFGGKVKYGLSSPNYIKYGHRVKATADGRRDFEPFATHISRDRGESPTAIIKFVSLLNYSWQNCNANVIDYMLTSTLLKDSLDKFVVLLKSAIKMGIFQIQFNVTSYEKLVEARSNPNLYPELIVRVWGFSAYFNDLPEEYKDLLIARAKEVENLA